MLSIAQILEDGNYSDYCDQLYDSTQVRAILCLLEVLADLEDHLTDRHHEVLHETLNSLRSALQLLEQMPDYLAKNDEQIADILRKFVRRDFDHLYDLTLGMDQD